MDFVAKRILILKEDGLIRMYQIILTLGPGQPYVEYNLHKYINISEGQYKLLAKQTNANEEMLFRDESDAKDFIALLLPYLDAVKMMMKMIGVIR